MISINIYTEEIDDLELAVDELREQLKDFAFRKNTLAIAFCDVDTDEEALVEELHKYYDFPIIGTTAVAMLNSCAGYRSTGISVLIMSSDNTEFIAGVTAELTAENAAEEIHKTYTELKEQLTLPEKLALIYAPQMNYLYGDNIIKYFDKAACPTALYGGIASDNFELDNTRVFYNELSSQSRIVLVLIGGRIKPIFQDRFSIVKTEEVIDTVAKSQDNTVYEMSGGKFVDVLTSKGMNIENNGTYLKFICSVFEADIAVSETEHVPVMRDLRSVDLEEGSAVFLGNVPVGSKMKLCMLNKDNIRSSVKTAFEDVIKQIAANPDYKYTTILCTSCAGRFLNLSTEPEAEGSMCQEMLPEGVSLCGMYSFGEICPTQAPSGKSYNLFHNKTFTLVAL